MTTTERVRLALRGPQGVGRRDFADIAHNSIGSALTRLQAKGEAFPAKVGHKTVRWFETKERADAYVAITPKPPKWGVTIHRRPKFDPDAPMVTTDKTIYTFAPKPVRCLRTNTFGQLG